MHDLKDDDIPSVKPADSVMGDSVPLLPALSTASQADAPLSCAEKSDCLVEHPLACSKTPSGVDSVPEVQLLLETHGGDDSLQSNETTGLATNENSHDNTHLDTKLDSLEKCADEGLRCEKEKVLEYLAVEENDSKLSIEESIELPESVKQNASVVLARTATKNTATENTVTENLTTENPAMENPVAEKMDYIDRALNNQQVDFSSDDEDSKPKSLTNRSSGGLDSNHNSRINDNSSSDASNSDSDSDSGADSDSDSGADSDLGSESESESESGVEEECALKEAQLGSTQEILNANDTHKKKRRKGRGSKNDLSDVDDDDDDSGPLRTANEIVDGPAPKLPENLVLKADTPIEYAGTLFTVSEKSLLVSAGVSGEFRILNENSIFCFEDRSPIGVLYETFGRIQAPMYLVKFDSPEQAAEFKTRVGEKVYYVVPNSSFVLTETIKRFKGCDASNIHDEEVPEEEQEFSDDEKERERKQKSKSKKKKKKNKNSANGNGSNSAQSRSTNAGISEDGTEPRLGNSTEGNQTVKRQYSNNIQEFGNRGKMRKYNNNNGQHRNQPFLHNDRQESGFYNSPQPQYGGYQYPYPPQQQYQQYSSGYSNGPQAPGVYWNQAGQPNTSMQQPVIPPEQLQLLQQLASTLHNQQQHQPAPYNHGYPGYGMGQSIPQAGVPNAASLVMQAAASGSLLASLGLQQGQNNNNSNNDNDSDQNQNYYGGPNYGPGYNNGF